MNWPRVALITIFILSGVLLGVSWITGNDVEEWPNALRWALVVPLVVALIVLGKDERRREKEEDTWTDDPRKSKFENWIEKRRQRFSPKRGLGFFALGLVVFSVMVGFTAAIEGIASPGGAIAFVLGFSFLGGLIGMFTDRVPF